MRRLSVAVDLGGPVWTITLQLAPQALIKGALSAKCHAGRHAQRRRRGTKKGGEKNLNSPQGASETVAEETDEGFQTQTLGLKGRGAKNLRTNMPFSFIEKKHNSKCLMVTEIRTSSQKWSKGGRKKNKNKLT